MEKFSVSCPGPEKVLMKPANLGHVIRVLLSKLRLVHWLALLSIYALLALKSALEFNPQYDFLRYHLPAMPDWYGHTTYVPESHIRARIEGYPPFPWIVGGFLAVYGGRLSFANAVNFLFFIVSLFVMFFTLKKRIHWRWFLTSLLAVPMFWFHIISGYIDFAAGITLTTAFACLLALEHGYTDRRWLAFCVVAGVAMLCRYQAWPVVLIYAGCAVLRVTLVDKLRLRQLIAALALLIFCLIPWPIRNTIKFGNPAYPMSTPFLTTYFSNYQRPSMRVSDVPEAIRELSNPVRFLYSMFELDNWRSPDSPPWTFDQWRKGEKTNPHHRMGGWCLPTMVLLIISLLTHLRADRATRWSCTALLCAGVAISCFPSSSNLRYWLFIPFSLCLIFSLGKGAISKNAFAAIASLLVVCSIYVGASVDLFSLSPSTPADTAPNRIKQAWPKMQTGVWYARCYPPRTIYYAGPNFNEYRVEACK